MLCNSSIPYFYPVQFLYPLFLIAGLSLLVPLLIHLFNLRKYKTVLFPHTRFLKNLQLHSKKQSELRYKWLLLARLLFLLFLVLAFAQPFFPQSKSKANLTAIYLDNSLSMSLRQGQRSMFEIAQEKAIQLIQKSSGKFLILTNDKPVSYKPLSAQKAIEMVQRLTISSGNKKSAQVLTELKSMMQDAASSTVDLYYLSDFQQNQFEAKPQDAALAGVRFFGVQIKQPDIPNVRIDTAYFESPILQVGQSNRLIVHTSTSGDLEQEMPVLQLQVDNQVKSAAKLDFTTIAQRIDTLVFQSNALGWQKILLSVNDRYFHADDSFIIAARSSAELSVLLINESVPNVYLQSALRSYPGFRVKEQSSQAPLTVGDGYHLVLLNGLKQMNNNVAQFITEALQKGQNVCIFPDPALDIAAFNQRFANIAEIQLKLVDTTAQTIASMQAEHPLIREMFESLPDNVQLPSVQLHFPIQSGLNAQQQSVFSFRNGDAFLASFPLYKGQLFLCATPILPQYGNFQSSYFFVPFLYQMATQAKGFQIFALTSGQKTPVMVAVPDGGGQQSLLHIRAVDLDLVPAQRPEGMGIQFSVPNLPFGFYTVSTGGKDSTLIALNTSRAESQLQTWSISALKNNWSGEDIRWQQVEFSDRVKLASEQSAFPLWKLCAILALAMLCLETWMLSRSSKFTPSKSI